MKKFVFFLNLTAITTFFVLLFSTGTHAGCTKDIDCKGNRVCEKSIAKDGRFIAYADGTVLDTNTNLMWAAMDIGANINWYNAKSYCENYRGGGYTDWRMPTQNELAGLYDAGKTYTPKCDASPVHLTELIHLTCYCLWASEMRESEAATFCFNFGYRYWIPQSLYYGVLPVRSGK
jgi:hypothetical protein